jgi:hypothetical protein
MSTLPEFWIVLGVKCNLSTSVFSVSKTTASSTVRKTSNMTKKMGLGKNYENENVNNCY